MYIHSPQLKQRLLGYTFLYEGKDHFQSIIEQTKPLLQETFAVAEALHFREIHGEKHFDMSEFMVPSSQEEFKNTYVQLIVNAAKRFAPNLPLRVNDKTISIRLTGPSLERMHHALYNTYENEPYWNQHFNENYPGLVQMFTFYKQNKTRTEEHEKTTKPLYRYVKNGDRTFIHFDISDEFMARLSHICMNVHNDRLRNNEHNQYISENVLKPIKDIFMMLHMVLLVNEMYDGLKTKTDAHKQAYIQQTLDARKAQFDVYKDWFVTNRIISEEVGMEMLGLQGIELAEAFNQLPRFDTSYILPLDIKPELPIGLELRLYQDKEDTKKWVGTIMTPELEQPQRDGYNNPAVGTITSIKDNGSVVVNDFLDVEIDYSDIRDTLVHYTNIETIGLLADFDDATKTHVETLVNRMKVNDKVESSPVGVGIPETKKEEMETITLDELMARHGIRPNAPQQEAPVVDVPEAPPQPEPEAPEEFSIDIFPSGYRLTNHGDGNFSLTFEENGGQVFHLGINAEEVKAHLLRLGFVPNFPAMVHCDRNAEHARSLAHPFTEFQNYLLI